MKNEEKMVVLGVLLFLTVTVSLASAVTHSMHYIRTAVTPGTNFPEFTVVGMVDGEPFIYYDSNIKKDIPKTEWIKKVVNYEAGFFDRQTQMHLATEQVFKGNVAILMQRFNQSEGVHTVQFMYGCELDEDKTKRGYMQYGYDGEDFISLDLNFGTWTAPVSQAVPTKQKWERAGEGSRVKNYLENECIDWIEKYVGYGKSVLERKVRPEVSLFQKGSPSEVVCHATGFFPKAVMISWQKNGEELNEDVELRETLTNQDGTFQKRSILTLSPEELKNGDKYTCVVHHEGLEEDLVLKVSDCGVLSGASGVSVVVIVGVVVAVLLLVITACVVYLMKKFDFRPVPDCKTVPDCKSYPRFKTDSLSSNSCLLAVSVCSQAGVSVEVVAGDNVTLWCRHGLIKSDYLFWCKHTNNSVPVNIACRYYSLTLRPNRCRVITDSERVEMMVNSENSSLTIRSVTDSDSGLYYCSALREKYMIYSHSTYLQIRESSRIPDKAPAGSAADGVFPLLTLLFGTMNAVLLSALLVLIFIIQSYRKELREERGEGSPKIRLKDPYVQCLYELTN